MSVSKPKRASFRIDDILSLKTNSNDQPSYEESNSTSDSDENATKDANVRLLFPSENVHIHQSNSHSSLLQEIGNRKRKREELERTLSDHDGLFQNCDTKINNSDFERQKHSLDSENNNYSGVNTRDKIYPVTPRATKLPTSLESLMRTHAHDYLLKLPAFTPWTVLSNRIGLFPPGLDLPSTGHEHKHCICGSLSCTSHRADYPIGSDGPGNFLRPIHSPNSPISGHEPSIPIPLPVYVRTRDVTTLDGGNKPKKCRRSRTVFTELQLMGLEKKFETQKYLSTPDRIDIADRLGLTQLQVKTWYQNRRMKWKKQVLQGGGTEAPTKPKGRPRKDSIYADSSYSTDSPNPNIVDSDVELSDV